VSRRSIAPPLALLQLGLDRVCAAQRDPLEAMCVPGASSREMEAAIRALHAAIPAWDRWWCRYADSASASYPKITDELVRYLAGCDLRRLMSLFTAAVQEQARAGYAPAGERRQSKRVP
jgi:hypothetical protein